MAMDLVPGDDVVELTPIETTAPARGDDSGRLNELLAVLSLVAFIYNLLRD